MSDDRIPIKQEGKVVGYVHPPLYLRLWQTVKRWMNWLRELHD